MSVATGIICAWPSTNASIPTGWLEDTALSSKYPKGAASGQDGGVSGGSANHTHTSPTHSHTMSAHTHTYSLGAATGSTADTGDSTDQSIRTGHTHTGGNTGAVSGGGLSSVQATYGSIANDPPYLEVIWIKSQGTHNIPNGAVTYLNSATVPTGFTEYAAAINKYLKGVSAGGNGGGTGGSTTNVHPLTHTHGTSGHTHADATSGAASGTLENSNTSPAEVPNSTHTHTVVFSSTDDAISSTTNDITCDETVEPVYRKLVVIENTSGGYTLKEGVVCLWRGTRSSIPFGWSEVTAMREKYAKGANGTGELGDSGGSNSHTHASKTHTHAASGTHNHPAPDVAHTAQVDRTDSPDRPVAVPSVVHAITVGTETSAYSTESTTGDSSSNEPSYLTVLYVEKVVDAGGAYLMGAL